MPQSASFLIRILPAFGLLAGMGLWLAVSTASPGSSAITDLDGRLSAAARPPRPIGPAGRNAATLAEMILSRPLMAVTAGAVSEPRLVLQGVVSTAAGGDALLAIGDAPAVWLRAGESRQGVTLRQVERSGVVVESLTGEHSLVLGGAVGASAAARLPVQLPAPKSAAPTSATP